MEHSHIVPPLPSNGSSREGFRRARGDAQDAMALPLCSLCPSVREHVLVLAHCVSLSPPSVREHVLVWAHCVAVYLLPCSVFLSLNAAIVLKLRRRSCFRLRGYSTGKTTAILLAITSVFAVLWAPRTAIILYHLYAGPAALTSDPARVRTLHLLSDLANMLALLNTAVNFFLYCFISRRFRRMAAGVLRSTCGCRGRRPPPAPVFAAHSSVSMTSSPWVSPASSHCIRMLVHPPERHNTHSARLSS
ncbi:probable G-protein coupled receptor 139 [Alosa alosa]|uniref:probable G-protein coupled receptor 139 n=1 Tax=Alosa alosa TaxID=278164 RepID=UPI0020152B01|nr:probable G-protein coupled receptor 139 [Alosa alosa]